VPHAKGVGADWSFATSSAATRYTQNFHVSADAVIPLSLGTLKRSNGWKNMRNSSLSFA